MLKLYWHIIKYVKVVARQDLKTNIIGSPLMCSHSSIYSVNYVFEAINRLSKWMCNYQEVISGN